jgi:hypothetical protein
VISPNGLLSSLGVCQHQDESNPFLFAKKKSTHHVLFEQRQKFKDEFDYRYKIGDRDPTMMNVISHAYLSSRVPLIDTFEQIIKYAKGHENVWFARRGDVAAWARKYYEWLAFRSFKG